MKFHFYKGTEIRLNALPAKDENLRLPSQNFRGRRNGNFDGNSAETGNRKFRANSIHNCKYNFI